METEVVLLRTTNRLGMHIGEDMVTVHAASVCKGRACSIHNPSDHHMKEWPKLWRDDRKLMERTCPEHGIGHPDPDHMAFIRRAKGEQATYYEGMHGCCGCCQEPESDNNTKTETLD
jgi:hypothetical protein